MDATGVDPAFAGEPDPARVISSDRYAVKARLGSVPSFGTKACQTPNPVKDTATISMPLLTVVIVIVVSILTSISSTSEINVIQHGADDTPVHCMKLANCPADCRSRR